VGQRPQGLVKRLDSRVVGRIVRCGTVSVKRWYSSSRFVALFIPFGGMSSGAGTGGE